MLRESLCALGCAAALLCLLIASPSAETLKLAVAGATFVEDYTEAPLSSEGLLGVMAIGSGEAPDPTQLTVWLPEHSATMLWVDIESADGLYTARAEYGIDGVKSTRCILEFPTEHDDRLEEYRAEELAILATLHEAPKSETPDTLDPVGQGIAVATWDSSATLDSLVVLFSSGGASFMELAVLTTQADTGIACFRADPQHQRYCTAYDGQCRIAVDTAFQLNTAIVARQNQFGMPLGQIDVPIKLP